MQVEIWSDVVCPWCAVGRARLERALEVFEHRAEVEVLWRSFELDPGAPRLVPGDLADQFASKYGMTREQAVAQNQQLTELAAADGLEFRFERARRGNTFDAHRLLHLAAEHGIQDAVKERLFRGYFTDGAPIGEHATLVRLAAEAGLDADEAAAVLASDRFAAEVRADEAQAVAFGISAVPFYVLDRTYGIGGAQPVETLTAALTQAWERTPSA